MHLAYGLLQLLLCPDNAVVTGVGTILYGLQLHRIKARATYWCRGERGYNELKNFIPTLSRAMQNQLAAGRTEDFQRKKQAIHLALCTVLSEEEAVGAIRSWEKHVSSSVSLFNGLHLFARKVCVTYGKDNRHVELAQAMSRALMGGGVERASNDAEVNDSAAMLCGTEIRTPEFASFQRLLLALLHRVTERDVALGGACREFLVNAVDNLPWSPEQQKQVINLINQGSTMQIRPYRPDQLKTLMRHLGVWMKEMLGEDVSSDYLQYAIGITEQSEAGTAYSPRQFFAR